MYHHHKLRQNLLNLYFQLRIYYHFCLLPTRMADALIYALFVDDTHRRCGVAQHLLQLAEQQAKLNGVKTIGLEFNKEESDRFVLDWYLHSGYKLFDKKSNLLIKKI